MLAAMTHPSRVLNLDMKAKLCMPKSYIYNLTNGLFQPYRKPNDEPLCINTKSDQPPTVSKQISAAINRRLSVLSSNKETFDKAKPLYDKAFGSSGVYESLHYCKRNTSAPTNRNIIGCNCRKKAQCPLNNDCLVTSVIYKANMTTDKDDTGKNYIELTEAIQTTIYAM